MRSILIGLLALVLVSASPPRAIAKTADALASTFLLKGGFKGAFASWNRAEASSPYRKSAPGLTSFKSLLVPGWSQIAAGERTKAYVFLTAEAILIGGIVAENYYARWLEDDYAAFAAQHAGVGNDRAHQFYIDIGNWENREAFNQQRLRWREFDGMYLNASDDWTWDSEPNRLQFKASRIRADDARQRAMLLGGGLLLNHLLSFIDASRMGGERTRISGTAHSGGVLIRVATNF